MATAGIKKLVVLVDDLDRCLLETAIETLEAIRLFVMLPNTAFFIGADENMIKYAVTKHFPNLPDGEVAAEYPRAYLEKLIQVPFRIPSMGHAETRTYLTLLVVSSIIGETSNIISGTTTMIQGWPDAIIRTCEGFAYLAVVIDLYSRRVIGWAMQSRQTTDVVLQALLMAVWRRKPKDKVLVHSDQGSQFTSMDWASFLKHHNLVHSMSRRGNCHDNAVAESFFNLLKRERIRRRVYR